MRRRDLYVSNCIAKKDNSGETDVMNPFSCSLLTQPTQLPRLQSTTGSYNPTSHSPHTPLHIPPVDVFMLVQSSCNEIFYSESHPFHLHVIDPQLR